jgi:pyruvate formate lyase activating enzyme
MSLLLLKNSNIDYEIRTTVVPGIHTKKVMISICKEIKGVKKYVLQPFVPRENIPDKKLRIVGRTSRKLLEDYSTLCSKYMDNVSIR